MLNTDVFASIEISQLANVVGGAEVGGEVSKDGGKIDVKTDPPQSQYMDCMERMGGTHYAWYDPRGWFGKSNYQQARDTCRGYKGSPENPQ
jgi:hypothetical protein